MKNARFLVNRALSVLGAPGIIGIGLLLFSAGLYHSWIIPAQTEVAAMEEKADRRQHRSAPQTVKHGNQDPLAEFYDFFPLVGTGAEWLDKVYGLAEKQGLELPKGEYQLTVNAQDKLTSYQAMFPLKGTYQQLRAFIENVLNELPFASLDDLRLEKQRTADTAVDSQVKLTFFLRAR